MSRPRLSALLTCHNRVRHTLRCLESLRAQRDPPAAVDAVVVDAGSSDGTAVAVRRRFPEVTVLMRGADLYWNAGMREAWAHALSGGYDHYLWLNDDVVLDPDAVGRLLETRDAVLAERAIPVMVAGSMRDPDDGTVTYGGVHRPTRLRPLRFELVPPAAAPRPCETVHGNCVLVPREVVQRVGMLDAAFSHGMGDFDYGLRARRRGCEVWLAPGTVGTCARNPPSADAATLGGHVERLTHRKGLPPREWLVFARRWAGPLWPIYAASPYLRRTARYVVGRSRPG